MEPQSEYRGSYMSGHFDKVSFCDPPSSVVRLLTIDLSDNS